MSFAATLRLAVLGAFLVHRPRRSLLRFVVRDALVLVGLLDVLVLAFAFVAPGLWHGWITSRAYRHRPPPLAPGSSRPSAEGLRGRCEGSSPVAAMPSA